MILLNRTLLSCRHVFKQPLKAYKTKLKETGLQFSTVVKTPRHRTLGLQKTSTCSQSFEENNRSCTTRTCHLRYQRSFSTSSTYLQAGDKQSDDKESADLDESKGLSIYQRFKRAYKEHGKVLVGVHLVTSTVWISSFYYLVVSGVDIVPIIESWEIFSADKIAHLKSSHAKDMVQAYLMYKLATPARYTITLLGTNFTIRYFQKTGRMPKAEERESLKDIVKDGRQEFKARRKEIDSQFKTRTKNLRYKRKRVKPGARNDS